MNNKISIIISTKKFNNELYKTITSINRQSYNPIEIILVSHQKILKDFHLNNKILLKKFTSKIKNQVFQRNIAIKNISKNSDLVLQLDDRILLEKNCLYQLNKFWNRANKSIVGVGLNQTNTSNDSGLFNKFINNYFNFKGKLLSNGIAIDYSNVNKDLQVMWLKGGMSSWRYNAIKKNENRKYPMWTWSVYEDVEFSLIQNKNKKLFVCQNAKAKIIERKKIIGIKNLFYRGKIHTFAQKRLVKKYFKSMNFFFLSIPLLICLSLIISVFTFNISKFIYNLGRIIGFFIIHFD